MKHGRLRGHRQLHASYIRQHVNSPSPTCVIWKSLLHMIRNDYHAGSKHGRFLPKAYITHSPRGSQTRNNTSCRSRNRHPSFRPCFYRMDRQMIPLELLTPHARHYLYRTFWIPPTVPSRRLTAQSKHYIVFVRKQNGRQMTHHHLIPPNL